MSKDKERTEKGDSNSDGLLVDQPSPARKRSAKLGIGCCVVLAIGLIAAAVIELTTDQEDAVPATTVAPTAFP